MEEAYRRLKRDPLFHVVTKEAFTHLGNLHLTIGELRLDTPQRLDAACQLLRSLEKDKGRQVLKVSETLPFMVDLVGVGDSPVRRTEGDLSQLIRLYTNVREPTNSLRDFCWKLNSVSRTEGFGVSDPRQVRPSRSPLQVKLADTGQAAESGIRNMRPDRNENLLRRFDARAIHAEYTDAPWMEDIQLEEIRISEIGRPRKPDRTLLQHAYNDIATAALPGDCDTQPTRSGLGDQVFTKRQRLSFKDIRSRSVGALPSVERSAAQIY